LQPRRTLLFAPAGDERKATKACTLGADLVVLDLEDAVAHAEKERAREVLAALLPGLAPHRPLVRVNGVETPWFADDLRAVVSAAIRGIVLPKVEGPEAVRAAAELVGRLEAERGLPPGALEILPFVETAQGLLAAEAIARSSPRIRCLAFGGMDFLADVGASGGGNDIFLYARSHLVVASRAAGIDAPVDTVYPDFRDTEGLVAEALRARALGFQGKIVIHPVQVEPVNRVFTPTPEEVAQARRIVAAFEAAEAAGVAVIQVDGRMIEYPIAQRARRTVALAAALGLDSAK
jgi:citrate lyase subunit beta/citryl-CoA lyase